MGGDDTTQRIGYIHKLLKMCPNENRKVIKTLTEFLNRISKFSETSKMTPSNLAIVFTPTLLRAKDEYTDVMKMLEEAPIVTAIVEMIIDQYSTFFKDDEPDSARTQLGWKTTHVVDLGDVSTPETKASGSMTMLMDAVVG